MTRKDYENAVNVIAHHNAVVGFSDENEYDAVVELFSKFFAKDNSRFDAHRFEEACKKATE